MQNNSSSIDIDTVNTWQLGNKAAAFEQFPQESTLLDHSRKQLAASIYIYIYIISLVYHYYIVVGLNGTY